MFGLSKNQNPLEDISEKVGELREEGKELGAVDQVELEEATSEKEKEDFSASEAGVERFEKRVEQLGSKREENPVEFIEDALEITEDARNLVESHMQVMENDAVPHLRQLRSRGNTKKASRKEREIEDTVLTCEEILEISLGICEDAEAVAEQEGNKKLHNEVQQEASRLNSDLEKVRSIEN